MPKINNINNFIIPAQDSNCYDLYYSEIIGGVSGCVANVNGVTVNVAPQSNIFITINSFSDGIGCFLGGYQPDKLTKSFVSVWDTSRTSTGSSTETQVKLPFSSTGTYNFIVDWGDGTTDRITTWNQAQTTHTYAIAGVYKVIITGTIEGFRFAGTGDRLKLLSVFKWGTGLRLMGGGQQFDGCANLDLSEVEDVLNLTGFGLFSNAFKGCTRLSVVNRMNEWDVSNMSTFGSTFIQCPNFNTYIGDWDTSNVTDMSRMFDATAGVGNSVGKFNQDISKWNTSKVTTFRTMFQQQPNFNQDISTKVVTVGSKTYIAWDTSNATDMAFMLTAGSNNLGQFNQNIGNWNTSKVTGMNTILFNQPYFNQDISTKVVTVNGVTYTAWDTSNVTNMSNMFALNTSFQSFSSFNQNIGNWNISKVTNLSGMFAGQIIFNQDISTKVVTVGASTYTAWDTLNVTNMSNMFNVSIEVTTTFNQNIGNWNTSKVTTMAGMFQNQTLFNQNISTKTVTVGASTYTAWNTSLVTTLSALFGGNFLKAFNQNISNWNTTNVTNMNYTFRNANQFNQPIGIWNTAKVTTMLAMLYNASSFNQNLANWNISLVTAFDDATFGGFADGIGLSTANYDTLLIGWASRPVLANKAINFGIVKYSSASVSARLILTSAPNNWTIVDGGLE